MAVPFAPLLHGPQSGTATGPDTPTLPIWMCEAVAAPVRCENVSRQVILAPPFDCSAAFAVKSPTALAGTPAAFGTSFLAFRFATRLKLAACREAAAPTERTS